MHRNRFDRQMLLRLLMLFSITGLVAAVLPLPHFGSQAQTTDTMTPFYKTMSGLYGTR